VVLHSDNGSAMKGATMLATLEHLGVVPSFSRPRVITQEFVADTHTLGTVRAEITAQAHLTAVRCVNRPGFTRHP
jgi:hypothetical protein